MRLSLRWRRTAFALGLFLATSALMAACGGGDGPGSDEDYVKSFCEANEIFDDIIAIAISATLNDSDDEPDEDQLISTFEEWADALDDANPPADFAEYHNSLVDGLREALAAAKRGESDAESMFDELDDLPEPPQAIRDRLAAVATDVPECEGQDVFG